MVECLFSAWRQLVLNAPDLLGVLNKTSAGYRRWLVWKNLDLVGTLRNRVVSMPIRPDRSSETKENQENYRSDKR